MNVECSSEIESSEDYLTAGEVETWIQGLPPGATLEPKIRDRGNQRDPEPALVGLKASWSETR